MMLDGEQQKRFLEEHIPYRLYLLDTLCAMTLLLNFDKHILKDRNAATFAIVTADGAAHAPIVDLHNMSVEVGLIQARLLIEFMGLRIDRKSGRLAIQKPKNDDVAICHFIFDGERNLTGLRIEQIEMLGSITLQDGVDVSAHDLLAYMLLSVNKSAAHITAREKQNPGFRWFAGALLIRVLIVRIPI